MLATNLLKWLVTPITAVILTLAFIVSAIRHSFWLLALIPIRAYKKLTTSNKKKRFLIISVALFFTLLYQPFIQLPNAGFIGFANQMEYHLDNLTNPIAANSNGEYPVSIETLSGIPTSLQNQEPSNIYHWWNSLKNDMSVRPQHEDRQTKIDFLEKRNVSMINESHFVRVYNPERMNQMMPYEPIPEPTTSFSFLIMPMNEVFERGRPPYPKHVLLVLIGYAIFITLISKLITIIINKTFNLKNSD